MFLYNSEFSFIKYFPQNHPTFVSLAIVTFVTGSTLVKADSVYGSEIVTYLDIHIIAHCRFQLTNHQSNFIKNAYSSLLNLR